MCGAKLGACKANSCLAFPRLNRLAGSSNKSSTFVCAYLNADATKNDWIETRKAAIKHMGYTHGVVFDVATCKWLPPGTLVEKLYEDVGQASSVSSGQQLLILSLSTRVLTSTTKSTTRPSFSGSLR